MSRHFNSRFAEKIQDFLVFKRALGNPYERAEFTLRSFDRFVQQQAEFEQVEDLQALILRWLWESPNRKSVSVTNELGVLREFCRFLRRTDPLVVIPARNWAPQSTESQFLPYIFTKDEIWRLLSATETMLRTAIRRRTFKTLILILYCTGLRFGEAVRLRLKDIDFAQNRCFINNSKRRSRWVPYHQDLADELQKYRAVRDGLTGVESDGAFFVQPNGAPIAVGSASSTLRSLFRRLGMKPPKGRVGPRPYDLRHTYAVHRLTRWYQDGVDVQTRLPWLSAYMGHNDLSGTEKYLSATPELLAIAANRFERRVGSLTNV